jgi:hypothetical protein
MNNHLDPDFIVLLLENLTSTLPRGIILIYNYIAP